MTLQQALQAKVRIEPGQKIRTFGGWCRHDRVLLNGAEIGRIQTRRGRSRIEVITIADNVYTMGYDIEWLVEQGDDSYGLNSTAA